MTRLLQGPIHIEDHLGATPGEAGALSLFAGAVRNRHEGRSVIGIHYHAYAPLAERRLSEVEAETARRFSVHCRVLHATGELKVGDVSVLILVHAPHRAEAFEACRYAIDTLKQTVPIWKEERFIEGDSAYVKGTPLQATPSQNPSS